jgi:hypothetical protein
MSAQFTAALASSKPLQVLHVQAAAETGHLNNACRLSCTVRRCHAQALALRVINIKSKPADTRAPPAIGILCCILQNAGYASQQLFICTTGVNERRPSRLSSRHNFCGHTSEFPASTFATADLLQRAWPLQAQGPPAAGLSTCRASAAILNTPPGPP